MKQKNRKIISNILVRVIGIILIALVFVGCITISVLSNKEGLLYQKFFGNKADVQGIVELWNIDTFESGTASKVSHLERMALQFEKQNKGAYILIKNMTYDECKELLSQGQLPDSFSFSAALAPAIKEYLTELEEQPSVNAVATSSARTSMQELLALPWCMGGYTLISTNERCERAGAVINDNLFSNVYNLGYEKKLKKSTQIVYSVVYGEKNKNSPVSALEEEARVLGLSLNMDKLATAQNSTEMTQYNAYSYWASGKATVLLGTQRDLSRLDGRLKSGKEQGEIIYPLSYYTDLVQYIAVAKNQDKDKQKLCENFAKFLISSEAQKQLYKIGMFSVISLDEPLYSDNLFSRLENSLTGVNKIDNIFV